MPFLGLIIMAGLLWWIFSSGGSTSNQAASRAGSNPDVSHGDLLGRFVTLLGFGWPEFSKHIPKGRWPIVAAGLFVFIRDENFFFQTLHIKYLRGNGVHQIGF